MKNKYKYFLILLLLMGLVPSNKTWALSGSGTLADPYLITTCTELQSMNNNLSAHYKLANAIDCNASYGWNSGKGFKPIGTPSTPFTGSLDGDFHPVMNLVIERTAEDYVGLFGYVDSPHFIKNISVEGEVHGRNYTGGLAGFAKTDLTHIFSFVRLDGNNFTGGVAGSFEGDAYYLFSGTEPIGFDNSGMVFGEFKSGIISDVQAPMRGFVGNNNVGGIIGIMRSGTLKNALVTSSVVSSGNPAPATISGTSQIGALIGKKEGGTVLNSYWDADNIIPNSSDGGTGLTQTQIQNPSSYTGWDFTDVWIESHAVDPANPNVPVLRGYLYFLGMLPDPPASPSPAAPPSSPSGLTAAQRTTTSVTLSWDTVPSATNYIVKRDGVQVGSGSGTTFTDNGLTKTTAYLYEVIAQNADGDSSPASLNVTTLTDDWVMVSAGYGHVLGLKNNGTVWAWGYNASGQLGTGDRISLMIPTQVKGVGGIGFLQNVRTVSANQHSSYALLNNGKVVSWGDNQYGRLGDGTTTRRLTPIYVKSSSGSGDLTGIDKIDAGRYFILALSNTGTVYSWGRNDLGQLGLGDTLDRSLPTLVKDESNLNNLNSVIDINSAYNNSFAIKSDGTVFSWGTNSASSDDLGYGGSAAQLYPRLIPGLTNVKSISAGERHVITQKNDDSLTFWGRNIWGQFGNGTKGNATPLTNISSFDPVRLFTAGKDQTFVIKQDGTLWGSGYGADGQLGNNTLYPSTYGSYVPVRVLNNDGTNALTNVKFVTASIYNSTVFFIKEDGTLWGFGDNNDYVLGDGTVITRSLPVKVGEIDPPTSATSSFTASNITTSSIQLNWASNAEATSYILKRNGVQIYSGTSLSYTDSGLNPDTTYTYELVARNAGGDSPPSSLNAKTLILRIWNIIAPNPTLNFGTVTLDGSIQNMTANLGELKVSLQGANPDGWRVTVSATPFSQVSGSLTLPQNSLRLNGVQTIVQTAGSSLLPTATAGSSVIDNGAVEIFSASAGRGEGDFDVRFPSDALELTIDTRLPLADPVQNPTVYQSTITWSMIVGP